jgi:RNA polymerase sigma-70 factor (ECF subfamily)
MAEPPLTRVTLLNRLKDGADADAWHEFVHLYGPVVYGFARKRGLQDADAADLMQEVLRSVARNAVRMEYDPKRGTFRGWLYTVTRNKIYNFLNGQRNRPRGSGDPSAQDRLDSIADRNSDREDDWELEYQRQLSAKAMEAVQDEFQPNTWQAFWRTAVEGRPAQDVGSELKMTPGAVYVAKSRVLARLREEVQRLQAEAEAW